MADYNRANAATQGFLAGFGAVDSFIQNRENRRIREEELAANRKFRERGMKIAEAGNQRQQLAFDEQVRLADLEREYQSLIAKGEPTEQQLSEFAQQGSVGAAQEIQRRQDLSRRVDALGIAGDAAAQAERDQLAQVEGLLAEDDAALAAAEANPGVTESIAQADELAPAAVPGDELATRPLTTAEYSEQTGQQVVGAVPIEVPANTLTLDEINKRVRDGRMSLTEAEQVKAEQAASLGSIEVDPRTGASTYGERARGQAKQINTDWENYVDVREDSPLRDLPSSVITGKYYQDYSNLSEENRQATIPQVAPHVRQTINENAAVVFNPEVDQNSREYRNAKRKYRQATGLAEEMGIDYKPAQRANIRDEGLPQGNDQLAADYRAQVDNQPRMSAPMPQHQRRALETAHTRMQANPARRATPAQLNRIAQGVAYGYYSPAQAQYMASHGGQLPPASPEYIKLGKDQSLYAATPGGAISLIRGPADDAGNRNVVDDDTYGQLGDYFSAYNTDDAPERGNEIRGGFLAFLNRTADAATAAGYDLSNRLDVASLAERYAQVAVFSEQFNNEWYEGGDWFPEFKDHFGSLEEAVYGSKVDAFIRKKDKEFFNEFDDVEMDSLPVGAIDRIRAGMQQSNDPRLVQLESQLTNQDIAKLIRNPDAQQALDAHLGL